MQTSEETKILIAENFKLLLQKHKFSEITVCMLCEKCNLNRKFFYKYFRDKYDLANFIFKKDFLDEYANQNPTFSEIFEPMIFYFYENQKLYKKLLEKVEQNSFTETLHKLIFEYISKEKALTLYVSEQEKIFTVNFFTDALVVSIRKWIISSNPYPAQQYLANLEGLFVPLIDRLF